MIDGLHFDIESSELAELLAGLVEHHEKRASTYAMPSILASSMLEYSNGDPVRPLRDKQAKHSSLAKEFAWMRSHIVPNEVYRLDREDMVRLEILASRY